MLFPQTPRCVIAEGDSIPRHPFHQLDSVDASYVLRNLIPSKECIFQLSTNDHLLCNAPVSTPGVQQPGHWRLYPRVCV